jgi:hypothetical protein
MNKFINILLFVLLFFAFGNKLYAQGTSTQGKDFWLSFGRNWNYAANSINMQLRIVTGTNSANVTLTYTQSGTSTTISIPAGTVYTYTLNNTDKSRVFSNTTGISTKSIHIESDVPVSVYALSQYTNTADATNILPVDGLGTDYYHISYRSNNTTYQDGYTLVATANATNIYNEGILVATLNQGQVYSRYYIGAVDSTGRHINSDKPVAYFVTNGGVWIPNSTNNGADCLYQQLVPVNKWGKNFLVPVTHRGLERIRIVAAHDGTVITQVGGVIKTDNDGYGQNSLNLDKGQFVELETNLSTCGCYISSNNPVGVCSYLVGKDYNPPVARGDPSMAWVPPIEQAINGALIAPFALTSNDEHYALIVTPTATKNFTTIVEGTAPATGLTGGTWCDNNDSGNSFYSLQIDNNESYYFANPYGLTVMGYGIRDYESYYYMAGSASRNLDAAFYLNNTHYQDLDGGVLCDTVANFRASIQYAQSTTPGYLEWYIDGTLQSAYTDILQWSRKLSLGNHSVLLKVLDMDDNIIELSANFDVGYSNYDTIYREICLGDHYVDADFDTIPVAAEFIQISRNRTNTFICDSIITLNLTVHPSYYVHDTVVICDNELPYTYRDTIFDVGSISGIYVFSYITNHGCDSIITFNLTVNPTYDLKGTIIICDSELPYTYRDTIFDVGTLSGNFVFNRKTVNNCDSITTLTLTVNPTYNLKDTIVICDSELPYTYRDTVFDVGTLSGDFVFNRKTVNNCDSITNLNLTVNPTYNLHDNKIICDNELPYTYRDTIFDAGTLSGDFVFNRKTVNNCDSITTLTLTVNPTYDFQDNTVICDSELPYTYRDTVFDVGSISGVYVFNHKTIHNCDSIITLTLTVNPTYDIKDTIIICDNELPYTYRDTVFNTGSISGNYVFNRKTINSCDSITTLTLKVNPTYNLKDTIVICDSELPYTYGDTVFNIGTLSNNFVLKRKTIHGCDSITALNLTVNPAYNFQDNIAICDSELPYTYRDTIFDVGSVTGIYVFHHKTIHNCDSIITLKLTVNLTYNLHDNKIICDNALPYTYRDTVFDVGTVNGVFMFYRKSRYGCDSITTLTLTVNPTYNLYDNAEICENDLPYIYYDTIFESGTLSGNFAIKRKTILGCDSIVNLNLTVHPSYYDTMNNEICQYELYAEHGFTPSTLVAGFFTYSNVDITTNGCDSITVLNLTVHPVYDEYVSAKIYEDEFYTVGSHKYNTADLHITNLQTQQGCDSVISLNLSIIYYPSEITAFSPFNKDGINDYFMAGFKVQIFNRYGVLVYETITEQEQELGWDGRNYNGQDVEPGIYFYILYNSSGKPRIKSSVEVLQR